MLSQEHEKMNLLNSINCQLNIKFSKGCEYKELKEIALLIAREYELIKELKTQLADEDNLTVFNGRHKYHQDQFRLYYESFKNLENSISQAADIPFLPEIQEHIFSFLDNVDSNITKTVCNKWAFFSHNAIPSSLKGLVDSHQLSYQACVKLMCGGFSKLHPVTQQDITSNPVFVDYLLVKEGIPLEFFTEIVHKPYGGVSLVVEKRDAIKQLMQSSDNLVEKLLKEHPAGNQKLLANAEMLVEGLREINVSFDDFFLNKNALNAFYSAYSDMFSKTPKDQWKIILLEAKNNAEQQRRLTF